MSSNAAEHNEKRGVVEPGRTPGLGGPRRPLTERMAEKAAADASKRLDARKARPSR